MAPTRDWVACEGPPALFAALALAICSRRAADDLRIVEASLLLAEATAAGVDEGDIDKGLRGVADWGFLNKAGLAGGLWRADGRADKVLEAYPEVKGAGAGLSSPAELGRTGETPSEDLDDDFFNGGREFESDGASRVGVCEDGTRGESER